jgi:hypothetical protein
MVSDSGLYVLATRAAELGCKQSESTCLIYCNPFIGHDLSCITLDLFQNETQTITLFLYCGCIAALTTSICVS